ncbi:fatty acid/phospholipid synthesis protein PlsX [Peptoanaerobacter stomatis]|uniref:Phosphate acyltransferase n=1 Tax=Peptoanaerobacter stomatis TaxID=796937 RepID=G9XCQ3_9FIRM|nr:phosphate acyltransferase PlsX [Peptoanaerobacter stomatis]EHL19239.1 fatty acid/phospholipid synthesis protein PlsX [Peptoanaerobacter stomatis]
MRIAIDTMGGDFAPQAQINGALESIKELGVDVVLLGDENVINDFLKTKTYDKTKVSVVHCSENITNDDKPVISIKKKKNSPMVLGCNMLVEGKADALVSSGSTGALLTSGMLITGRIEGIQRPALTTVYPKTNGATVLLDVGANAQCKPEHINQFAFMGYAYAKAVLNLENPKVGLINIGTEEKKGSQAYIDAYQMLKDNKFINFIGNVEARDIPSTEADVLVCDGFTGNIVLKLSEGLVIHMMKLIKNSFMSSLKSKIGALLVKSSLKNMKKSLDYEEYGGAILLGTNGTVIKAHGSSNEKAFKNAIKQAKKIYDADLVKSIKQFAAENKAKNEDKTEE